MTDQTQTEPIHSPAVAEKFASYAPGARAQMLALRQLILDTAAATPGVGMIEEALKWGQPSYSTPETHSGTPVRIDAHGSGAAIYVNCQTDLVETFRRHYPNLEYEGQRAIVVREGADANVLGHCVAMALTFHARKKRGAR